MEADYMSAFEGVINNLERRYSETHQIDEEELEV